MFKLIKYELRATFLTIVGICIFVIIANLLLMTRKGSWDITIISGLSVCLAIGAMVVIFISSLNIMSKYLFGDSGYLLFTLPQSGKSIITSRVLTALIQISIVIFASVFMCYLTVTDKIDLSFLKNFKASEVSYFIISYIWGIVYSLTFIYFCMVIGKVALKGKKIGKIGSFIIFILLSVAISWLSFKITNLLPQTLNLNDFSITTKNALINSNFATTGGTVNINIASTVFDILTFVGLFTTTSYLIDKKLDLS